MANSLVSGIISLTLGIIMLTSVFIPQVKGANTTEFTAAETAMYSVVGLAAIIGVVYGTFSVFGLV